VQFVASVGTRESIAASRGIFYVCIIAQRAEQRESIDLIYMFVFGRNSFGRRHGSLHAWGFAAMGLGSSRNFNITICQSPLPANVSSDDRERGCLAFQGASAAIPCKEAWRTEY
jgi:hypothetical protein